jgi:hypothetical protein
MAARAHRRVPGCRHRRPHPENVALYLYLQRVALDKSSRFAAATQRAVQRDPFLDEITQRPTATFAANLVNRQTGDHRDQILQRIAQSAGVLFFFRSDCPYCEAQAPLLRLLESGQRGPQPPSAHRTVRTGPYTAPHARRIH